MCKVTHDIIHYLCYITLQYSIHNSIVYNNKIGNNLNIHQQRTGHMWLIGIFLQWNSMQLLKRKFFVHWHMYWILSIFLSKFIIHPLCLVLVPGRLPFFGMDLLCPIALSLRCWGPEELSAGDSSLALSPLELWLPVAVFLSPKP